MKLAAVAAILALAAIAAFRSLRPTALVEPVIAAEAIDARPGSVTVIPEYVMELKSETPGHLLPMASISSPAPSSASAKSSRGWTRATS